MTEGGISNSIGRNEYITCCFMLRQNNKYISENFYDYFGGQNEAVAQVVILDSAVRY